MMSRFIMLNVLLKSSLGLCVALMSMCAMAATNAAGNAIFVFGKAQVFAADGSARALSKGGELFEGDRIVTGVNGRVQIRMGDGGLLALRPATEFLIEAFHYPQNQDDDFGVQREASFFALLKGGFRSITGAVGKKDKEAYRVRTPVATIGIRGTDYDAMLCAGDCAALSAAVGQPIADGLYVGVNSGAVRVMNESGFVDLEMNEFGVVTGTKAAPRSSTMARDVLAPSTQAQVNNNTSVESTAQVTASEEVAAPDTGLAAQTSDPSAPTVDFNTGVTTTNDTTGAVAFSNLPGVGTGSAGVGNAALATAPDQSLSGFSFDGTRYGVSSAQSLNVGRDDARTGATGLSWGRWAGGDITATDDAGTTTLAVQGSTHWVASDDNTPTPQIPVTGTQSFQLIGNTDPTDNQGNVGTLGSADLTANFDAQTVDADVSLSFAQTNQVWDASARDVDINGSDATFSGAFDDVTITDGDDSVSGSGGLSGFFSGDADGAINGAGFSYGLSDDVGTDVAGSAAFQMDADGN